MAMTMTCDGCTTAIPLETQPVGQLAKVFYCPTCKGHLDEMEKAILGLHAAVVKMFESGREDIVQHARAKLMKLPDE